MNTPKYYILHHSLTTDGVVLKDFTAIKHYHVDTLGWDDIGYHWILESVNGKLVWIKGRDEDVVGAHCREDLMNFNSIGICVVGNFDKSILTSEHYEMLRLKIKELDAKYGECPIHPHSEHATYKTCPGTKFDMDKVIAFCRLKTVDELKVIIQAKCEFSTPLRVWMLMDQHKYSYEFYKKWAESYND